MYFDAATVCANDVFNDDGVLITLILHPECVLRLIYELANTLSPIPCAPDQV